MNWSLVKKDFMLLLKSPLTYIGVLSMVVILYITVSPYIKLYDDFQPDGETMEYSYDGNITDGYIPTPENERWEYVSQEMEAYLVSECEMSHEDAQKQMDEVLSKGWTVQEIRQFFIDEYGIVGFQSVWNMSAYKKADAGQFDVRLRAEPARTGLHGLEPALCHLYCDIYAAADRHADLLGRDPRPLFAQEDDLHARLPFLRGLPCRCADPEPRLVQLSDARGLLLYHRLDQQHLLCRLRQLLSPADL